MPERVGVGGRDRIAPEDACGQTEYVKTLAFASPSSILANIFLWTLNL